ncbi:MAG: hypothetical protein KAT69_00085 [Candidatus Aminicenantes bacterium]|nr:hypothetical protein [Candidatus Aminicenantes bacterium]
MKAYSESKTPTGDGDRRQTPKSVFNRIQTLINMPFVHDVAAEPHTAKCASFWTVDDDALSKDWREPLIDSGSLTKALWMNCPYSDVTPWVQKACDAAKRGVIVVGCLPDDRSVSWYQQYVEDKAQIIYVPDRRISFEDSDGVPQRGNPKGTVFPVWMPFYCDKSSYVRFKL